MARKSKSNGSETRSVDSSTQALVNKVWGFCHTLRDDGVGASEYLEQLTYLLFLKMADELGKDVPTKYSWPVLRQKSGSELSEFYTELLTNLAKEPGMVGQIFLQAKNAINKPATLSRIVNMIDQQVWTGLDTDLKGSIYEEILEKTASDKKSGAGQYFTPRALIEAIVACVRPEPGKTICDPASGTGGFLLKAYEYISKNYGRDLDADQKRFLKNRTFYGNEIVPTTRRLCLMNLYLHNIGELDGTPTILPDDSLIADSGSRFDYVITNPPFGTKSSQTITNDEGVEVKESVNYNRQDFWTSTSNKQLNFVQHIHTILKTTGHAAVVLPDDVLFEGGAGETIRRKLMETTDLHTILRLPTGIFYAPGVKANVLFFDARSASKHAQTKEVWVYDYRTNIHHTLKQNPLRASDLADFIACYHPEDRYKRTETWSELSNEGRWRKFAYSEILKRPKTNLDFKWIKDKGIEYSDISWGSVKLALDECRDRIVKALKTLHSVRVPSNDVEGDEDVPFSRMTLREVSVLARGKILDLAIRGKLVEQNEDDEPADVLLGRIAAEKEHQIAQKIIKKEKPLPSIEGDGDLSELPAGWAWCRFSDVIKYLRPDNYIVHSEDYDDSYETPVLTAGQTFILGRTNETDGHYCATPNRPVIIFDDFTTSTQWVDFEFKVKSSAMKILEPISADLVDLRYLFYAIRNVNYKPSTHARQWIDKFSKFALALPPLAEQKRIVAKVDEMLAACDMLTGGVCGS